MENRKECCEMLGIQGEIQLLSDDIAFVEKTSSLHNERGDANHTKTLAK